METNGSEKKTWWELPAAWKAVLSEREEQVFLVLTLLIGALVGLAVVAFIVLTERLGARLYPVGGAAWRRLDICCTNIFPMREEAECRKRKRRCLQGMGRSRLGRYSENFSVRRQRSRVAYRWGAKDRRCRWAVESLPCWAGRWG